MKTATVVNLDLTNRLTIKAIHEANPGVNFNKLEDIRAAYDAGELDLITGNLLQQSGLTVAVDDTSGEIVYRHNGEITAQFGMSDLVTYTVAAYREIALDAHYNSYYDLTCQLRFRDQWAESLRYSKGLGVYYHDGLYCICSRNKETGEFGKTLAEFTYAELFSDFP